MAACAKCGTPVGCNCNLTAGGLCAKCAQEQRQEKLSELTPRPPQINTPASNGPK